MLVKLKYPWFAATESVRRDKIQTTSGQRFSKGVQEIPAKYRDQLPSTAIILEKKPEVEEQVEFDLKDFDEIRKSDDLMIQKLDEAEKAAEILKKSRQDRMAKARAAKNKKADENKDD